MKKALLIATTLMALGLPAQAIQLNQVNQGHQDQLSQQGQPGQGKTGICTPFHRQGC